MARTSWLALVGLSMACGSPGGGGLDAGTDAGVDAGPRPGKSDGGVLAVFRTPLVTGLNPVTASSHAAGFALEVTGGFDADAVVRWDGRALVTRVTSGSRLEADVPAEELLLSGPHDVTVLHTGPKGAGSPPQLFTVVEGPAIPALGTLVPDRTLEASPAFEARVRGWNFTPASVVTWAGAPRATRFISSGDLAVMIPASDVASPGTAQVTVSTPGAGAGSNALTFTVDMRAAPPTGTQRVNLAFDGGESTGSVRSATMSGDGRYVVFSSFAADLVPDDTNGREDVFVRDTCRGASACTPSTIRVSVAQDGGQATADSRFPVISESGRHVAFVSLARNLTPSVPTAFQNIFARDTCLGATACTPTTERISVRFDDGEITTGADTPIISGDGRWVLFLSDSPDLVADDTSVRDSYMRDTCFGATGACTPSTRRVSQLADGGNLSRATNAHGVSRSGRFVTFVTGSAELDAGAFPVTLGRNHAYLEDNCIGATGCTPSLTLLDVALDGGEASSGMSDQSMGVSADGRWVVFATFASNLTPLSTGGSQQVYLADTCRGATACAPGISMVTVGLSGQGADSFATKPALTPDGRFAAFVSGATDLVAADTNGREDLFVRDLCSGASGCTPRTLRVSSSADGGVTNNHTGSSMPPGISNDGTIACWPSNASNVVDDDTNGDSDAFLAGTGF